MSDTANDKEMKMKGKAAVDVVGERLGKAGGGYLQQILLIITGGSVLGLTPILLVLVVFIVSGWIWAVLKLNVRYNKLVSEKTINDDISPNTSPKTYYNEERGQESIS